MKFELKRYWIEVIPESEEDEAFIKDTLGLRKADDHIRLVRKNAVGLSRVSYLKTEKDQ